MNAKMDGWKNQNPPCLPGFLSFTLSLPSSLSLSLHSLICYDRIAPHYLSFPSFLFSIVNHISIIPPYFLPLFVSRFHLRSMHMNCSPFAFFPPPSSPFFSIPTSFRHSAVQKKKKKKTNLGTKEVFQQLSHCNREPPGPFFMSRTEKRSMKEGCP